MGKITTNKEVRARAAERKPPYDNLYPCGDCRKYKAPNCGQHRTCAEYHEWLAPTWARLRRKLGRGS